MQHERNTVCPQEVLRRGFSLVESAIVLGVAALILAALWGLTSVILERVKVTRTVSQITTTVQNIQDIWRGRGALTGDFATLTNRLIRESILPADMVTDRTADPLAATNTWGGTYSVNDNRLGTDGLTAAGGALAGGMTFRIRLTGLPRAGCIALATRVAGTTASSAPLTTVINGNVVTPVTVPNANANCVAGNANTIDFVYRLRATGA